MVMKNFDNSLRLYNIQVLKRTKLHVYTKKYIDNLMKKSMFGKLEVPLVKLTKEDIENIKLSLIKNKDNIPKQEGIDDEPAEKKQKLDTNGINVFKSVLSRESETRAFESQLNSSLKPIKEIASTSTEEVPTVIDCDESTKSENSPSKNVWPMINVIDARRMMDIDCDESTKSENSEKITNGINILKSVLSRENETRAFESQLNSSLKPIKEIASTSIEEVPTVIDCDESTKSENSEKITNGINILKSVLSRENETRAFESQLNSSLKPIKKIVFTSTEEVPTVIDCDESTKSENSSAKNVWPKINVIDARKMMEDDKYINWMNGLGIIPKRIRNGKTNLAVAKPFTSKLNPSSHSTKVNELKYPSNANNHVRGDLNEIEKIFKKYFGKSELDTVIIIANIVNIISISNKHLKERMDESFKKKSEAEKLKERCNANHIHEMHKTILETKLKTNVEYVISHFQESEFHLAFTMFFLSILTVLRVLDQPKYAKTRVFNKLLITLSTSLKNRAYNHPKMFSMFQSRKFRTECIKTITLIEGFQESDPGIVTRMPLFFVSSVDNKQYFQAAIDTVTGKLNENLELLIDNATTQCSINSNFKYFVHSSTVEHSNCKLPVTETVQRLINPDIITEPTRRFKNQYQLIPVVKRGNKAQTIGNAGVEPSIVTIQPLNNFYDPFSSSLQKKMSASSSSTVIPTKNYTVVTHIISNSPLYLHQTASSSDTATPVPSKRTLLTPNRSIQIIKTEPNSSPHITQRHIISVDKKPKKTLRMPASRMGAAHIGTNSLGKQPSTNVIECSNNNCKIPVTVMCSVCLDVKYCSRSCQRQHWETHQYECENILRGRQTLP